MQFMQGRYGMDKLNQVLMIGALVLYGISLFLRKTVYPYAVINLLYIIAMIIVLVRMFSRNIYKRQEELNKYMLFQNRLTGWWRNLRNRSQSNVIDLKARRNYKYLKCPQCMQKLRVPRGKGKLRVTCTKCGCKFETKS